MLFSLAIGYGKVMLNALVILDGRSLKNLTNSFAIRETFNQEIMMFKILHPEFAIPIYAPTSLWWVFTRGYQQRFMVPLSRIDAHLSSFPRQPIDGETVSQLQCLERHAFIENFKSTVDAILGCCHPTLKPFGNTLFYTHTSYSVVVRSVHR